MNNRFLKCIAILILCVFVTNTVCYSAPDFVYRLRVTEETGKVRERWSASLVRSKKNEVRSVGTQCLASSETPMPRVPGAMQQKSVIIIEDAHTSLDAQEKIAGIVGEIEGQLGERFLCRDVAGGASPDSTLRPMLLGIEGASGKLTAPSVTTFPDTELKKEVLHQYVESGKLSGAEYEALTSERNIELFGIEDRDLYCDNADAFTQSIALRKEACVFVTQLQTHIHEALQKTFSGDLAILDEADTAFGADTSPFEEYLQTIITLAHKNDISLEDFFNLYTVSTYPDLAAERDVLHVTQLLSECHEAVYRIKNVLAKTEEEKRLVDADKVASVLQTLLTLTANHDTRRFYAEHREMFREERLGELFGDYVGNASSAAQTLEDKDLRALHRALTFVDDYYRLADARNEAFVAKTIDALTCANRSVATIVTGGYHTQGLTDILKEKGISYAVVTPSLKNPEIDFSYTDLMLNTKSAYESLIESSLTTLQALRSAWLLTRDITEGVQRSEYFQTQLAADLFSGAAVKDIQANGAVAVSNTALKSRLADAGWQHAVPFDLERIIAIGEEVGFVELSINDEGRVYKQFRSLPAAVTLLPDSKRAIVGAVKEMFLKNRLADDLTQASPETDAFVESLTRMETGEDEQGLDIYVRTLLKELPTIGPLELNVSEETRKAVRAQLYNRANPEINAFVERWREYVDNHPDLFDIHGNHVHALYHNMHALSDAVVLPWIAENMRTDNDFSTDTYEKLVERAKVGFFYFIANRVGCEGLHDAPLRMQQLIDGFVKYLSAFEVTCDDGVVVEFASEKKVVAVGLGNDTPRPIGHPSQEGTIYIANTSLNSPLERGARRAGCVTITKLSDTSEPQYKNLDPQYADQADMKKPIGALFAEREIIAGTFFARFRDEAPDPKKWKPLFEESEELGVDEDQLANRYAKMSAEELKKQFSYLRRGHENDNAVTTDELDFAGFSHLVTRAYGTVISWKNSENLIATNQEYANDAEFVRILKGLKDESKEMIAVVVFLREWAYRHWDGEPKVRSDIVRQSMELEAWSMEGQSEFMRFAPRGYLDTDGTVTVDERLADVPEELGHTLAHEYRGHANIAYLKKTNPALWQQMVSVIFDGATEEELVSLLQALLVKIRYGYNTPRPAGTPLERGIQAEGNDVGGMSNSPLLRGVPDRAGCVTVELLSLSQIATTLAHSEEFGLRNADGTVIGFDRSKVAEELMAMWAEGGAVSAKEKVKSPLTLLRTSKNEKEDEEVASDLRTLINDFLVPVDQTDFDAATMPAYATTKPFTIEEGIETWNVLVSEVADKYFQKLTNINIGRLQKGNAVLINRSSEYEDNDVYLPGYCIVQRVDGDDVYLSPSGDEEHMRDDRYALQVGKMTKEELCNGEWEVLFIDEDALQNGIAYQIVRREFGDEAVIALQEMQRLAMIVQKICAKGVTMSRLVKECRRIFEEISSLSDESFISKKENLIKKYLERMEKLVGALLSMRVGIRTAGKENVQLPNLAPSLGIGWTFVADEFKDKVAKCYHLTITHKELIKKKLSGSDVSASIDWMRESVEYIEGFWKWYSLLLDDVRNVYAIDYKIDRTEFEARPFPAKIYTYFLNPIAECIQSNRHVKSPSPLTGEGWGEGDDAMRHAPGTMRILITDIFSRHQTATGRDLLAEAGLYDDWDAILKKDAAGFGRRYECWLMATVDTYELAKERRKREDERRKKELKEKERKAKEEKERERLKKERERLEKERKEREEKEKKQLKKITEKLDKMAGDLKKRAVSIDGMASIVGQTSFEHDVTVIVNTRLLQLARSGKLKDLKYDSIDDLVTALINGVDQAGNILQDDGDGIFDEEDAEVLRQLLIAEGVEKLIADVGESLTYTFVPDDNDERGKKAKETLARHAQDHAHSHTDEDLANLHAFQEKIGFNSTVKSIVLFCVLIGARLIGWLFDIDVDSIESVGMIMGAMVMPQQLPGSPQGQGSGLNTPEDWIKKYTINITDQTDEVIVESLYLEGKMAALHDVLVQKAKNNAVLVGEPECTRHLIRNIAYAINQANKNGASETLPRAFRNTHIVQLNIAAMLGELNKPMGYERRMRDLAREISRAAQESDEKYIFCFDFEKIAWIHDKRNEMVAEIPLLFKALLEETGVPVIGIASEAYYDRFFVKRSENINMESLFTKVALENMQFEDIQQLLYRHLNRAHELYPNSLPQTTRVTMDLDRTLTQVLHYMDELFDEKNTPVILLEMFDEIITQKLYARNNEELLRRHLYENIRELRDEIEKCKTDDNPQLTDFLYRSLESYEEEWRVLSEAAQSSGAIISLTFPDFAKCIAARKDISVDQLVENMDDKLDGLSDALASRVIGQDEVIAEIENAFQRRKAGVGDPNKPAGAFILTGPTGVGKTELTRALSDYYYGGEMVRLDMSEYMEKNAVWKLKGSPPGFVGYDQGGTLTEAVDKNPYSVVLLDEIDKAHPDVFGVLNEILGEGTCTNGAGKKVSFKNTIIIMTGNAGMQDPENRALVQVLADLREQLIQYDNVDKKDWIARVTAILNRHEHIKNAYQTDIMTLNYANELESSPKEIIEKVVRKIKRESDEKMKKALSRVFGAREDIIGRATELGGMFNCNALTRSDLEKILDIRLRELNTWLKPYEITLTFSNEVRKALIQEGYNPEMGARPLARAIKRMITASLADALLDGTLSKGRNICAEMAPDGGVVYVDRGAAVIEKADDTKLLTDDERAELEVVMAGILGDEPDVIEPSGIQLKSEEELLLDIPFDKEAIEKELEGISQQAGGEAKQMLAALEEQNQKEVTKLNDTFDNLSLKAKKKELPQAFCDPEVLMHATNVLKQRRRKNLFLVGGDTRLRDSMIDFMAKATMQGTLPGFENVRILRLNLNEVIEFMQGIGPLEECMSRLLKNIDEDDAAKGLTTYLHIDYDELQDTVSRYRRPPGAQLKEEVQKELFNLGFFMIPFEESNVRLLMSSKNKRIGDIPSVRRDFSTVRLAKMKKDETMRTFWLNIKEGFQKKLNGDNPKQIDMPFDLLSSALDMFEKYLPGDPLMETLLDFLVFIEPKKGEQDAAKKRAYLGKIKKLKDRVSMNVSFGKKDARHLAADKMVLALVKEIILAQKERAVDDEWCITEEDLYTYLIEKRGVSLDRINADEWDLIRQLEDRMKEKVLFQDDQIKRVVGAVKGGLLGLKDPTRPVATIAMNGPTGNGKTATAEAMAEALGWPVIRRNLSTITSVNELNTLIGAPPGYVGHNEGVEEYLTTEVIKNPKSVIILDEVDKALRNSFSVGGKSLVDILLPIFEDGRLTDSIGQTADFSQCIICMCTNGGIEEIWNPGQMKFERDETLYEDIKQLAFLTDEVQIESEYDRIFAKIDERVTTYSDQFLRPEMRNRIDEMITFGPLTREALIHILISKIGHEHARLAKRWGTEFEAADDSVFRQIAEMLITDSFDPKFGARSLIKALNDKYAMPLSAFVQRDGVERTVIVSCKNGRPVFAVKEEAIPDPLENLTPEEAFLFTRVEEGIAAKRDGEAIIIEEVEGWCDLTSRNAVRDDDTTPPFTKRAEVVAAETHDFFSRGVEDTLQPKVVADSLGKWQKNMVDDLPMAKIELCLNALVELGKRMNLQEAIVAQAQLLPDDFAVTKVKKLRNMYGPHVEFADKKYNVALLKEQLKDSVALGVRFSSGLSPLVHTVCFKKEWRDTAAITRYCQEYKLDALIPFLETLLVLKENGIELSYAYHDDEAYLWFSVPAKKDVLSPREVERIKKEKALSLRNALLAQAGVSVGSMKKEVGSSPGLRRDDAGGASPDSIQPSGITADLSGRSLAKTEAACLPMGVREMSDGRQGISREKNAMTAQKQLWNKACQLALLHRVESERISALTADVKKRFGSLGIKPILPEELTQIDKKSILFVPGVRAFFTDWDDDWLKPLSADDVFKLRPDLEELKKPLQAGSTTFYFSGMMMAKDSVKNDAYPVYVMPGVGQESVELEPGSVEGAASDTQVPVIPAPVLRSSSATEGGKTEVSNDLQSIQAVIDQLLILFDDLSRAMPDAVGEKSVYVYGRPIKDGKKMWRMLENVFQSGLFDAVNEETADRVEQSRGGLLLNKKENQIYVFQDNASYKEGDAALLSYPRAYVQGDLREITLRAVNVNDLSSGDWQCVPQKVRNEKRDMSELSSAKGGNREKQNSEKTPFIKDKKSQLPSADTYDAIIENYIIPFWNAVCGMDEGGKRTPVKDGDGKGMSLCHVWFGVDNKTMAESPQGVELEGGEAAVRFESMVNAQLFPSEFRGILITIMVLQTHINSEIDVDHSQSSFVSMIMRQKKISQYPQVNALLQYLKGQGTAVLCDKWSFDKEIWRVPELNMKFTYNKAKGSLSIELINKGVGRWYKTFESVDDICGISINKDNQLKIVLKGGYKGCVDKETYFFKDDRVCVIGRALSRRQGFQYDEGDAIIANARERIIDRYSSPSSQIEMKMENDFPDGYMPDLRGDIIVSENGRIKLGFFRRTLVDKWRFALSPEADEQDLKQFIVGELTVALREEIFGNVSLGEVVSFFDDKQVVEFATLQEAITSFAQSATAVIAEHNNPNVRPKNDFIKRCFFGVDQDGDGYMRTQYADGRADFMSKESTVMMRSFSDAFPDLAQVCNALGKYGVLYDRFLVEAGETVAEISAQLIDRANSRIELDEAVIDNAVGALWTHGESLDLTDIKKEYVGRFGDLKLSYRCDEANSRIVCEVSSSKTAGVCKTLYLDGASYKMAQPLWERYRMLKQVTFSYTDSDDLERMKRTVRRRIWRDRALQSVARNLMQLTGTESDDARKKVYYGLKQAIVNTNSGVLLGKDLVQNVRVGDIILCADENDYQVPYVVIKDDASSFTMRTLVVEDDRRCRQDELTVTRDDTDTIFEKYERVVYYPLPMLAEGEDDNARTGEGSLSSQFRQLAEAAVAVYAKNTDEKRMVKCAIQIREKGEAKLHLFFADGTDAWLDKNEYRRGQKLFFSFPGAYPDLAGACEALADTGILYDWFVVQAEDTVDELALRLAKRDVALSAFNEDRTNANRISAAVASLISCFRDIDVEAILQKYDITREGINVSYRVDQVSKSIVGEIYRNEFTNNRQVYESFTIDNADGRYALIAALWENYAALSELHVPLDLLSTLGKLIRFVTQKIVRDQKLQPVVEEFLQMSDLADSQRLGVLYHDFNKEVFEYPGTFLGDGDIKKIAVGDIVVVEEAMNNQIPYVVTNIKERVDGGVSVTIKSIFVDSDGSYLFLSFVLQENSCSSLLRDNKRVRHYPLAISTKEEAKPVGNVVVRSSVHPLVLQRSVENEENDATDILAFETPSMTVSVHNNARYEFSFKEPNTDAPFQKLVFVMDGERGFFDDNGVKTLELNILAYEGHSYDEATGRFYFELAEEEMEMLRGLELGTWSVAENQSISDASSERVFVVCAAGAGFVFGVPDTVTAVSTTVEHAGVDSTEETVKQSKSGKVAGDDANGESTTDNDGWKPMSEEAFIAQYGEAQSVRREDGREIYILDGTLCYQADADAQMIAIDAISNDSKLPFNPERVVSCPLVGQDAYLISSAKDRRLYLFDPVQTTLTVFNLAKKYDSYDAKEQFPFAPRVGREGEDDTKFFIAMYDAQKGACKKYCVSATLDDMRFMTNVSLVLPPVTIDAVSIEEMRELATCVTEYVSLIDSKFTDDKISEIAMDLWGNIMKLQMSMKFSESRKDAIRFFDGSYTLCEGDIVLMPQETWYTDVSGDERPLYKGVYRFSNNCLTAYDLEPWTRITPSQNDLLGKSVALAQLPDTYEFVVIPQKLFDGEMISVSESEGSTMSVVERTAADDPVVKDAFTQISERVVFGASLHVSTQKDVGFSQDELVSMGDGTLLVMFHPFQDVRETQKIPQLVGIYYVRRIDGGLMGYQPIADRGIFQFSNDEQLNRALVQLQNIMGEDSFVAVSRGAAVYDFMRELMQISGKDSFSDEERDALCRFLRACLRWEVIDEASVWERMKEKLSDFFIEWETGWKFTEPVASTFDSVVSRWVGQNVFDSFDFDALLRPGAILARAEYESVLQDIFERGGKEGVFIEVVDEAVASAEQRDTISLERVQNIFTFLDAMVERKRTASDEVVAEWQAIDAQSMVVKGLDLVYEDERLYVRDTMQDGAVKTPVLYDVSAVTHIYATREICVIALPEKALRRLHTDSETKTPGIVRNCNGYTFKWVTPEGFMRQGYDKEKCMVCRAYDVDDTAVLSDESASKVRRGQVSVPAFIVAHLMLSLEGQSAVVIRDGYSGQKVFHINEKTVFEYLRDTKRYVCTFEPGKGVWTFQVFRGTVLQSTSDVFSVSDEYGVPYVMERFDAGMQELDSQPVAQDEKRRAVSHDIVNELFLHEKVEALLAEYLPLEKWQVLVPDNVAWNTVIGEIGSESYVNATLKRLLSFASSESISAFLQKSKPCVYGRNHLIAELFETMYTVAGEVERDRDGLRKDGVDRKISREQLLEKVIQGIEQDGLLYIYQMVKESRFDDFSQQELLSPTKKYLFVNGKVFLHDANLENGALVSRDGDAPVVTAVNAELCDQIAKAKEISKLIHNVDLEVVVFLEDDGSVLNGGEQIEIMKQYLRALAPDEDLVATIGEENFLVGESFASMVNGMQATKILSAEDIFGVVNDTRKNSQQVKDSAQKKRQYYVELNPNAEWCYAPTEKKNQFTRFPSFLDAALALADMNRGGVERTKTLVSHVVMIPDDMVQYIRKYMQEAHRHNEAILSAA